MRALVTGGSGAIGAAICRRLAAAGRHVLVHAHRNLAEAERIVQNIRTGGGAAEAVAFDVTQEEESARALERVLAGGPVQIVVNNAGIHADAPMAGMSGEQWKRVLDVSLHGFFNVTKPLLLPMIGTRWGRIVSVSSVAALRGNRGQTNYAAAKAGLHGATRSLALELAPRGVTVNAVAPGIIASPMSAQAFPEAAINALVPMKRVGQPEEVAALVAFLASEEAGYISGQVISIDGGMA
ncbi:MAG TPA: 3-oxoacyl-ACP reductase FabG [Burkholderiales bacterium]|nr:3-oxoacyl-ACP reductase FabG [Burkholderiales bacterium]